MALPGSIEALYKKRIRKFRERAAQALDDSPVVELRQQWGDGRNLGMNLTFEFDSDGTPSDVTLEQPQLDRRLLNAVIVDCRVFFMVEEDCYLPSVVSALRGLLSPEGSRARKPLAEAVNAVVKDGRLRSPMMYSGRLEQDNGLGPNRLLGDDQIAMDYINGVAFHQDDSRVARLENASGDDTIRLAVLLQMNQLLLMVQNVSDQIESDLAHGYIEIE